MVRMGATLLDGLPGNGLAIKGSPDPNKSVAGEVLGGAAFAGGPIANGSMLPNRSEAGALGATAGAALGAAFEAAFGGPVPNGPNKSTGWDTNGATAGALVLKGPAVKGSVEPNKSSALGAALGRRVADGLAGWANEPPKRSSDPKRFVAGVEAARGVAAGFGAGFLGAVEGSEGPKGSVPNKSAAGAAGFTVAAALGAAGAIAGALAGPRANGST